jgi:hypothetical protein
MRDKLVTCQAKRDRMFRSPPHGTSETIHIESQSRFEIMNWKGEMKQTLAH